MSYIWSILGILRVHIHVLRVHIRVPEALWTLWMAFQGPMDLRDGHYGPIIGISLRGYTYDRYVKGDGLCLFRLRLVSAKWRKLQAAKRVGLKFSPILFIYKVLDGLYGI